MATTGVRKTGIPALFLTVTASTKRSPAAASGRIGAAVENLASISVTPFHPVDAEIAQRIPRLAGRQELLSVFVDESADILEGDILVVGGIEYPVRAVEDWTWEPSGLEFRRLVVEELK